tara:strand:- start:6059 stop:6598 length:540 start_codon:yes stop_codon:yes gene_type:complete
MSQSHPKAGPNFVPAYQVSGIPFVTSSASEEVPGPDSNTPGSLPVEVKFPFVTKFVTVRNTGNNELRVGFTADGVVAPGERLASADADKTLNAADGGRNYFLIPSASSAFHTPDQRNSASTAFTFDIRCKSVFFLSNATETASPGAEQSTSFSILAGLTSIPAEHFPVLTGSNGFQGVG